MTADEMWTELKRHDLLDEMIMLNTPGGFSGNTDECGLVNNHAYIVLEAKQTSNGDRLLKMRNPWGFEKWTCDWSDLSDKWTQAIRDELNWQLEDEENGDNDGVFWMTVEDFTARGWITQVAFDTNDWYQGYYLHFDDDSSTPGTMFACGPTCSRHVITVTSSVDQEVWLSAN